MLAFVERAARGRDARLSAERRKLDGVVHTPVPLARAMIREASALLARHELPPIGSLALDVVDPATGPGVFLAAALAGARGQGARLLGLDVDPDASFETRRVLRALAEARGFSLRLETRDALARPHETSKAVLVVGNPPWSARGAGPAYIESLVRDFHRDEHGVPLRERRRGVLADAYVRFLRWSIDAVERAPSGGAIALVTNASYLDGPVHRGVRAMLASSFDEVSILDLGGSALTARVPGTIDENVFGVRPSAAVVLAARTPRRTRARSVHYVAVRGRATEKLAALAEPQHPRSTLVREPIVALRPSAPREEQYASWPSLDDWFSFHAEGIQTNRDDVVVDRDRAALLDRLTSIALGRSRLTASAHFDPAEAVRALGALREAGQLEAHVASIAYRPFDARFAFLHPALCHRPRPPLLAAMSRSPLALVSVRQDRGALPWAHAALVRAPIDNCYLSARSSCRARAFPSHQGDGTANLSSTILGALARLGLDAQPDDLVAYLGAILAAPSYGRRFGSALALDYPRVPLPPDATTLRTLADLGRRLATLLAASATPVRAQASRAVTRVGHHAFDPRATALDLLASLRRDLDRTLAATGVLEGARRASMSGREP